VEELERGAQDALARGGGGPADLRDHSSVLERSFKSASRSRPSTCPSGPGRARPALPWISFRTSARSGTAGFVYLGRDRAGRRVSVAGRIRLSDYFLRVNAISAALNSAGSFPRFIQVSVEKWSSSATFRTSRHLHFTVGFIGSSTSPVRVTTPWASA